MRAVYYLKLLSLPLLFLFFYATLFFIWEAFNLPSPERSVEIVRAWFAAYGLIALFFAAIVEGLLLIGNYFPGVFVIFLGVVVADSPQEALLAVAIASAGLVISHVINYALGKYGWYTLLVRLGLKEAVAEAREKLEKKGPIAIPLSYWMPSIGALTNTAAGIIHLPFRIFMLYSVLSSLFWYSVVGAIVYVAGDAALSAMAGGPGLKVVAVAVAVWCALLLITDYAKRQEEGVVQ